MPLRRPFQPPAVDAHTSRILLGIPDLATTLAPQNYPPNPQGPSTREPRLTRVYSRLKGDPCVHPVYLRACHPVYRRPE